MSRCCRQSLAMAAVLLTVGVVRADVFQMPAGRTSLQFVAVGDRGDAADKTVMNDGTTGYGSVEYKYHIAKFDVTNAQYCEFLNAKAAKSDPYGLWMNEERSVADLASSQSEADVAAVLGLWHVGMSSSPEGGINRSGSGPYKYTVKPGHENQPVVWVSWYNTIRFANWLTNGQGNGDTETGTYTITGSGPDWTVAVPDASQRAAWAAESKQHFLLPSEDEWYKAAFYKKGSAKGGYWRYPTQSDAAPLSQVPGDGANAANFRDGSTDKLAVTHSANLSVICSFFPRTPTRFHVTST
jgi:formylglycine-generating enzyme